MAQNKTILVTGGAGYIGSHTCKMLKQQGYIPVVFDNLSNGHRHAVQWGPFIEGDLNDLDCVRQAFQDYEFASVIHFASFIEVGESVAHPEKYFTNNVGGTQSLLKVMAENNVKNIVFSSSCAVYGTPEIIPINEQTPHNPISPYGETKAEIEKILQEQSKTNGLRYVSCRYFNACGADPEAELGEEHDPESHIIPLALMAAAGQREGFHIYGDDYNTEDGTCVRDYIHVWDLAQAHISAHHYLQNQDDNLVVNLGTGGGYSVKQILDAIQKVTQKTIDIQIKPRRAGDPALLIADTSKAKNHLDFTPRYSDIETIIETAWNFYQNRQKANK